MKSSNTQTRLVKRTIKKFQTIALMLLVTPALLVLSTSNAIAGWNSGYYACKKTEIADVSDLTITEGAEALGLNVLVSVIPPDVAELLDSSENITVFAPTDEAFGNIPTDILSAIAVNDEVLTTVLAYHVSPKLVDPRKVLYIRKVGTLAEQNLFVNRARNAPKVNQSNVECQGYRTANGLVWVIDSVLLPQF